LNKVFPYFLTLFIIGCSPEKPVQTKVSNTLSVVKAKDSIIEKSIVKADTSRLEKYLFSNGLVNINDLDSTFKVNLIYNDTCNFLHTKIYDSLSKALLPCDVAIKLCNAQFYLKQINPELSLLIFDATRPHSIQKLIWDSLKMEPNLKYNYVATPWDISLHNYGAAIDLSIIDLKSNQQLDMGTTVDFFGKLAEPIYEKQFLKTKQLSDTAYHNRLLLRKVMQMARFYPITSEWWHFNSCNKDFAAQNYALIK